MAASPRYKVFDKANTYQGSAKEPELAVNMAAFLGDGATVRIMHAKAWTVFTHDTGDVNANANESIDCATLTLRANEKAVITRQADVRLRRQRGDRV